MVLTVVVGLVLMLGVAAGYRWPDRMGWILLYTVPLLGPSRIILIPSRIVPLGAYQLGFAVCVGMALNRGFRRRTNLRLARQSTVVVLLGILVALVTVKSFNDRLPYALFFFLPMFFIPVVLGYGLIRTSEDAARVLRILAWQGAIIGVMILIEYYGKIDFHILFTSTIPDYDSSHLRSIVNPDMRLGFVRVSGIDGNAVQTASRMVVLTIISMWLAISRKGVVNIVPLVACILGCVLLQTRAAYVSLSVGLGMLFILMAARKTFWRLILGRLSLYGILVSLGLVVSNSSIAEMFKRVTGNILGLLGSEYMDKSVYVKLDRIPMAIEAFKQQPFWGYGSKHTAYYDVMNTLDIPTPLIYLLSGGIIMFFVYILTVILPVLHMARVALSRCRPSFDRTMFAFVAAAFASGVLMSFSNWLEDQVFVMYLAYFCVCAIAPPVAPYRVRLRYRLEMNRRRVLGD